MAGDPEQLVVGAFRQDLPNLHHIVLYLPVDVAAERTEAESEHFSFVEYRFADVSHVGAFVIAKPSA